jgi:hypothetical protein
MAKFWNPTGCWQRYVRYHSAPRAFRSGRTSAPHGLANSPARHRRIGARSGCRMLSQVNGRRNDLIVDGRLDPGGSSSVALCRSGSMSSVLSASAIIPASGHGTFGPGFTPVRTAIVTMLAGQAVQTTAIGQGHEPGARPPRGTRLCLCGGWGLTSWCAIGRPGRS